MKQGVPTDAEKERIIEAQKNMVEALKEVVSGRAAFVALRDESDGELHYAIAVGGRLRFIYVDQDEVHVPQVLQ